MKKTLIIILILVGIAGGGNVACQFLDSSSQSNGAFTKISAEELKLLIETDPTANAATLENFQNSSEERQKVLKNLQETLALAVAARKAGYTDGSAYRENLGYMKNSLLARIYLARQRQKESGFHISKEEVEAFNAKPETEAQFNKYIDNQLAIEIENDKQLGKPDQGRQKPQGEALKELRENWARTTILAERASGDAEFMKNSEIDLRFNILEAQVLAANYLNRKIAPQTKAAASEIAQYLAAHPEYDLNKKREQAESALQRVKAGADFAKLAAEMSEDRISKDKGGLHENVGFGEYAVEIDEAVSKLKNNQIADQLIESPLGYHILKLESKKVEKAADNAEIIRYSFRHILFQKKFIEPGAAKPGIPPPFMTREEIAQAEIEKQKREKLVAEIVRQNQISLPPDFTIDASVKSAAVIKN